MENQQQLYDGISGDFGQAETEVGCVENLGELRHPITLAGPQMHVNIVRPAVAFDIVYVSICTKVISLFHGIESHVFTQISISSSAF